MLIQSGELLVGSIVRLLNSAQGSADRGIEQVMYPAESCKGVKSRRLFGGKQSIWRKQRKEVREQVILLSCKRWSTRRGPLR